MAKDYKVGHRRPPLETRWKKGQSGNPTGRRKGSRNAKTDWEEELFELVEVKEGGRRIKVSKHRALIKAAFAEAYGGDRKALLYVLGQALALLSGEAEAPSEVQGEEDAALLEAYLRRKRKGGGDV
jgi:hypothetical protein